VDKKIVLYVEILHISLKKHFQVVMLATLKKFLYFFKKKINNLKDSQVKANTHPDYNEIKVTCSCGDSFVTKSTLKNDLSIEVCSSCHPFYTGQQKIVDTAGRVDKFRKRFGIQSS
jgi:large subunit ribosomal protein L31